MPANRHDRIVDLEQQVQDLRRDLDAYRRRDLFHQTPRQIRTAITCAISASYPTAPADTYGIKFVDGTFTESAGDQTPTDTNRSATYQRIAHDRTPGRFLAEGTLVQVYEENSRWWIFHADQLLAWLELDATLTPGSSASATLCVWNGSIYGTTGGSTTLYDPHNRNFGLDGEKILCGRLNGRWEALGENGLLRRGTPDSNISSGSSGTVSIAGSSVNITGYVDWAEGGEQVSASKESWWKYQPDETQWYWLGGECE